MNALLQNTETEAEAGEKSDAEAPNDPEQRTLNLVLTKPPTVSTSGAQGTTVSYSCVQVIPGDGVAMVNCTPQIAEVNAKMQSELESKHKFLQEVINKNLKQTGVLLDNQECCEVILAKKAQLLMTNTCGVAETYVNKISKLSVNFLNGAEELEAAIRMGPTTRAKNSIAELEKRANKLLDGGNQLNDTFEVACKQFYPDIYTAEEEMKKAMLKRTNAGIKRFTQTVMDESVTPFLLPPELKVLGAEIAQMSYQHKINVRLICHQMSGDALYSHVRPILAQARASKAQLMMTQFLAKESVRSYKACVGPCVFGGTPALSLPSTPASATTMKAENELKSLLDSSTALFEGSSKKSASGKGVKSSMSKQSSTDSKDKVTRNLLDELSTPSKPDKPGVMPQTPKHDKPEKRRKRKKHGKHNKDEKREKRPKSDKHGKAGESNKGSEARPGENAVSIPKHGDKFSSNPDSLDSVADLAQGALDKAERRKRK